VAKRQRDTAFGQRPTHWIYPHALPRPKRRRHCVLPAQSKTAAKSVRSLWSAVAKRQRDTALANAQRTGFIHTHCQGQSAVATTFCRRSPKPRRRQSAHYGVRWQSDSATLLWPTPNAPDLPTRCQGQSAVATAFCRRSLKPRRRQSAHYGVRWQNDSATPLWPDPNALDLRTRTGKAKAPSSLRSAGAVHNRGGGRPLILECGGKATARHRFGQLPTHWIYPHALARPKRRRHCVLPAQSKRHASTGSALNQKTTGTRQMRASRTRRGGECSF
jgi:hypothetical protein